MPVANREELEKYPPPPLPGWIQRPHKAYFPDHTEPLLPYPEFQVQFFNKPTKTGKYGDPYWVSNYGAQTWTLVCPYDEICIGGERGGSKSAALIAWFAMGDPFLSVDDPARYSYLLEPSFRGLMLRKEYQSLSEFIDEAEAFFAPLGGKPKDDPVVFEFDKGKGAKIYTNHLGDKAAFEKYRGMGITKIGIEELTQIEEERSYLKLLGSLRAKRQVRIHNTPSGPKRFPALRSQIMSTTNPDGPGRAWVKKRFVKVYNGAGKLIPHNKPMRDQRSLTTRIFIPMHRKDNPYLRNNKQYEGFLLQQDEATQQAWIHGNWDYSDATFFCCDDQTEFLTIDGFKKIEDIQVGQLIATLGPAGEFTYAPCLRKVHQPYTGEMIQYETPQMSFCVTPNHRMYCEKDHGDNIPRNDLRFVRADELPRRSWHKIASSSFAGIPAPAEITISTPYANRRGKQECRCMVCGTPYLATPYRLRFRRQTTCSRKCSYEFRADHYGTASTATIPTEDIEAPHLPNARTFEMGDWLEFLGWYLSEGSGSGTKSVTISQQKNADHVRRIADLLDKMGFGYTYDGKGFQFTSITLRRHLKAFGVSHEKYIPREYLMYPRPLLQRLYDGLTLGDGFQKPSGGCHYYSVSRRLADDVQELAIKLGYRASISRRKQAMGREYGYYVGIYAPRHGIAVFKKKVNRVQYDGMVGCLTVDPYHTIMIRRNGRVMWTGNSEFRPDGPVSLEEREKYPWAKHVIEPVPLKPWWHRWGGGDWGYDHPAAFHKFCRSEVDGRIHCYDELMLRHYGSFEVGVRLAEWWLPDLEHLPDKAVTIAFSTDAFSTQDDTRTKAEQVANGIRSVLGPYGAFLMKFTDDERAAMAKDPSLAQRKFAQHREKSAGNLVIVLKPASKDVSARWSYMRELLRFRPLIQETEAQLKQRLDETYGRSGVEAYELELSKVKRREKENLPRLQIWKGKAPQLVRCLTEANRDEDHPEKIRKWNAIDGVGGDDAIEAAGHGLHHFKDIETRMPKSYYVTDRIEQIQVATEKETGERITDPTRLVMIHQTAESRYEKVHPTAGRQLYIPRASSGRHRHQRP